MARRSIRFAQNFLSDPRLAASIVAQARLSTKDVVYEIGPGTGILTQALARVCARVVAVEIDRRLFERLQARFANTPNVELHCGDFLRHRIRQRPYKVVASLPYNCTARLLRKLLGGGAPPEEAHLVVQEDAARKVAGTPRERQASVLLKPWFELAIVRRFRRRDFVPVPAVDSVLLRVTRRRRPLVDSAHAEFYRAFVRHGFGRWRANLRQNLREVFTPTQWKRLARDLGFPVRAQPTDLHFGQWLGLFEFLTVSAGPLCEPCHCGGRRRHPGHRRAARGR